jgi:hypothetical protein
MKLKARKKTPAAVLDKLADEWNAGFDEKGGNLWAQAKSLYDAQDVETRDAIDRIHDVVQQVFRSRIWISKTRTGERKVFSPSEDTHAKFTFYVAIEIAKDLALMDIRVGNFTFTKDCVECGKPVKSKKKGKR